MRMRLIWFALPYPAAAQSSPGCHCLVYSMSSVCDGHVLVSTEDKETERERKKKRQHSHANMSLFSFPEAQSEE